jgi:VanZ family protein
MRDRLAALAWWAVSVLLLVLPGSGEPVGPAWLVRLAESGGDKLVHCLLFFGLVVLTVRGLRPLDHGRALGVSVALALIWAPLSEWLQRRIPHRDSSLPDLAADLLGVALAAVLVWRRPGPARSS